MTSCMMSYAYVAYILLIYRLTYSQHELTDKIGLMSEKIVTLNVSIKKIKNPGHKTKNPQMLRVFFAIMPFKNSNSIFFTQNFFSEQNMKSK